MNTTTTETNVCVGCHTKYICYGVVIQWCYVNGTGPYCHKCAERGITVKHVLENMAKPHPAV